MMSTGLTRMEKEKLVMELYEEGKTYHQIAKEARISLRDIGPILNKAGIQQTLSNSSRAYTLFNEGKSPIQVAIALNLREKDVSEYYREYWKLNGLNLLNLIYEETKGHLWSVIELYKQVKAQDMNIQHVIRLLRVANNDIPSVENKLQELERKEDDLKYKNVHAARTAQEISDHISRERQTLEQFCVFVKQKQQEVERLYSEKKGLDNIIERFRSNDEIYIKIKEMVKEQIESGLASPGQLLRLALLSMIESSRINPSVFRALQYNMPSTRAAIVQRSFLQSLDSREIQHSNQNRNNDGACEKLLLDQAEGIYNQMLEDLANNCINKIANDTESPQSSSLISPEVLDAQYDQSNLEEKPTNPQVSNENDLIITKSCER
jgi:hypothetical protein